MANRAKPRARTKAAKGKIKSRGRVATLPKQSRKAKGAKAGIGHNSGTAGISDEMILRHDKSLRQGLKDIAELVVEVNQLRGVYRAARKLAKKEGFNLAAFDINWKLEQEDLGKIQQNYAAAAHYQQVVDSPLAQISMFDSLLPPKPAEEPAGVRGYKAGESGLVDQQANPFKPGTDDYVDWDAQWTAGQAALAKKGEGRGATH